MYCPRNGFFSDCETRLYWFLLVSNFEVQLVTQSLLWKICATSYTLSAGLFLFYRESERRRAVWTKRRGWRECPPIMSRPNPFSV